MKNRHWLLMVLLLMGMAGHAPAQILIVSNNAPSPSSPGNFSVLAYNFDGTFRTTIPLALAAEAPITIATDGTNLFADYYDLGVVSAYTTTGGIVNPSLISSLNSPGAMALDGTNLYVSVAGGIGKYSTSGAVINSNFVTGIGGYYVVGMAVLGTNIFAAINNTIKEFSTDGGIVNTSLVSMAAGASNLATDGTNLFVSLNNGTVAVYSTSGATVSSVLIDGLVQTYDPIAIVGTNLYVFQPSAHTVSQYATSGMLINPVLVSNFTQTIWGFAAASSGLPTPPPAAGITTYSNRPVVFWPAGGNYTLQMNTNLSSTNWVAVPSYIPVAGAIVTNAPPSAFFRLQPIGP